MSDEIVRWMEGMNLPIPQVLAKLPRRYSQTQVLWAIKQIYDKTPDIKPMNVFWKIRDILTQTPDSEDRQKVTDLYAALIKVDDLQKQVETLNGILARRSDSLNASLRRNRREEMRALLWKNDSWMKERQIEWLSRPWYIKIFDGPSEIGVW
jgi:excinuclease UvrABC helicase subunit UvrB